MDGTLLNKDDKITQRTKESIIRCQKKGIKIILASGRSYKRLIPYVKELKIKEHNGYLIEVNGMAVYKLLYDERRVIKKLEKNDIYEIFNFCKEQGAEVQCMLDDAVYYWIPEWQKELKEKERIERGLPVDYPNLGGAWTWITDSRNGYPKQVQIERWEEIPECINKINCLADPETNYRIFKNIKDRFSGKYEFVRTCPRLIEFSPKGITKWKTLKALMENENISKNEVMVFGDGENDVEMFKNVSYSFAMENAEDFIKKQAFAVTKSNVNDGVAEILEKLLKRIDNI